MASSSQANQPFVYEVFINFRGEDTRDNFVSHLFKALQHRGIQTYLDEENLEKGQPIKEDLEKAIKESRIVVVVLSENYGSSTWCLNELVKIMERKNKLSLFVIPIFYHVDPSVVRKQKRKFAEAFSEHEVEEVKSWKKALKQVSDLAGEHIRRKDNEASCVEKIVDMIFNKLSVKASAFRKSCVGIESRISKIRKLMDSKSEEVLFIGLWGMGGVGKTTLARAIFEDCKQSFEGSCFLGNVKGKKSEIHILQKKLLNTVLKKKLKGIDDVVTGASMISARLRFKRVLIVIDDVDNIQQLNDLANKFDWFGEGSRIIITTRDKHLIDEVHIEKFEVHGLPLNEALQLFSFHAFKDDHPHEDFKDLSLKVLSYADGLPLALSVLGDHLRQRPKDIWEDVLERLKDAPPDDIMGVLQISFDGLKEIEQNIFLDISCFFRGQFKDKVEERLESLGLHPKCGIDELHRKSLIYMRSVGPEIYVIEMHDLLQEMGWNINRNKCVRRLSNDDPRRYSRLWLQDDVIELLKFTEACEVERLLLSHVNPDDSMKPYLGWEVTFTNMSKLSLLEVSGDFFKGNYDANVTQPFGKFGNKLRWFSWYEYPGEFLPNGFHPQNLVQLHMKFSKIKGTPDFSHMPNLEVVDLCDSGLLVYVHPSLGNHIKIKRLDLCNCTSLEEFPSIHSMISLEFMDLSYTNIQNFPEICENLDSLRELKLEGTPINGLPKSISGIANGLQELMLICRRPYKEDFTSLDVVVKSFPGLVSIVIRGSGIISTLDFSHLPYLEKLDLSYSKKLVQVHASLGVHKGIKYINLSHCSKLKEFPPVVDMESLEKLNLSHTMLQKISEMSGNVKHLVELKLDNTLITTLPWSFGCATSLKILSMPYCDYLLQLPITILGLRREVIIIESGSVKYFMENYKDDDRVAFFDRNGLRAWTPGQPSRSCIYIRNCESLKQLPESLLSRTEVLEVEASPILVSWICFNLVDLLDKYQHLCNLRLHQCWIDDGDDDGGSAPNEYRLRRGF